MIFRNLIPRSLQQRFLTEEAMKEKKAEKIKIVLATRNPNKVREIRRLVTDADIKCIELLSLDDIGYHDEIPETGSTFAENAYIKASVPASLGYYGLADDSGLEVDFLLGAPGVYSARYAGEPCDDVANNEKLLDELLDVDDELRTARYVSVISFVSPYSVSEGGLFKGTCEGRILRKGRGSGGFGYDPLFFSDELGKTFAEVSLEEKNTVSHRARALCGLIEHLKYVFGDR